MIDHQPPPPPQKLAGGASVAPEVKPFSSSQELLSALVADKKVSDKGELLISSCIRLVVSDQSQKRLGTEGEDGKSTPSLASNSAASTGNGFQSQASMPPQTPREISVDSTGSSGYNDLLGSPSGGDNRGFDSLLGGDDNSFGEDRTLDFMFVWFFPPLHFLACALCFCLEFLLVIVWWLIVRLDAQGSTTKIFSLAWMEMELACQM